MSLLDRFAKNVENKDEIVSGDGHLSMNKEGSDCRDSDELFSDDNETRDTFCHSPDISKSIDCSSLNLSKTPLLHSDKQALNSSAATIPNTPLGLIPFLLNINEQWTADLETPQADKGAGNQIHIDRSVQSTGSAEKFLSIKQRTPKISCLQTVDNDSPVINSITSPIIVKRAKKRTKRRIFKSVTSTDCSSNSVHNVQTVIEKCKYDNECEEIRAMHQVIHINPENDDKNKCVNNDVYESENHQENRIVPEASVLNASINSANKICTSNFIWKDDIVNKLERYNESRCKEPIAETCQSERRNFDNINKNINNKNEIKPFKNIIANSNRPRISSFGVKLNFDVSHEKRFSLPKNAFTENNNLVNKENECDNELNMKKGLFERNSFQSSTFSSFSTAKGRPIDISEKALCKVQNLFTDQFDNNDYVSNEISESHNSTKCKDNFANEKSICDFEEAVSNMKEPLATTSNSIYEKNNRQNIILSSLNSLSTNDISDSNAPKQTTMEDKKLVKNQPTTAIKSYKRDSDGIFEKSSSSFVTANGRSLMISEKALSKAQQLFTNDINAIQVNENALSNDINLGKKSNDHVKNVSTSFVTGSGHLLRISEEALSKAQKLYAENVDNIKISEHTSLNDAKINTKDKPSSFLNVNNTSTSVKTVLETTVCNTDEVEPPREAKVTEEYQTHNEQNNTSYIGFKTARGHVVNITEESLSKAKVLLLDDVGNTPKSNDSSNHSQHKRKINEFDANTTLATHSFSSLKRTKLCDEYSESLPNDIKNKKKYTTNLEKNSRKDCDTSLLSNEIMASTAALLADENDSDRNVDWISCRQECKNDEIFSGPPSPIIGRQPIMRKKRKKVSNNSEEKQAISNKRKSNSESNYINLEARSPIFKKKTSNSRNIKQTLDDTNIDEVSSVQSDKIKPNAILSSEFNSDTQLLVDFIDQSTNIRQKRIAAVSQQEKIIDEKKRTKPKPIMSKLLLYKQTNNNVHLSWKKISGDSAPKPKDYEEVINENISSEVLKISATTASSYKFQCKNIYGDARNERNEYGIEMEDGGYLIPDESECAGILEFKRSFLASPGVDPNLLPAGWIENHYRWIVWKLASMDRMKFGEISLPKALTPSRVMAQIKYRYDREIDRSQRSALRRILEKDDSASKRMILCVSSITKCEDKEDIGKNSQGPSAFLRKMTLTDGWYSVPAFIDLPMMSYIFSGKVREGMKLITTGAELINCEQGCSPLETPSDVCLKIHTNSTRRIKWYAKLGYTSHAGPLPIKLRSVVPNGGLIGKIRIVIARVYPVLYHEKNAAGESIYRNSRCEEKVNHAYEEECRLKFEALYAKVEKKFDSGPKNCPDPDSMDLLAAEWNEEYDELSNYEALPRHRQEELLNHYSAKKEEFRQKMESKLRKSLPTPRQVSEVYRVRIVEDDAHAILKVWAPDEEIVDILKEGNCMSICNVTAAGRRSNDLQLIARRNTVFNKEAACKLPYLPRTFTSLHDVIKPSFDPSYGEFDTIGIISCIVACPYGMKNFEAVCLAYPYENLPRSSYLAILFWQGISTQGYAETLTVGSFISCSNLEWRRPVARNIPVAYFSEGTTFSHKPRQNHLQGPLKDLKSLITDPTSYSTKCAEEIVIEMQRKSSVQNSGQQTPGKSTFDKDMIITNKQTVDQISPSRVKHLMHNNILNSSIAKSSTIQKRLDKLKYYGDPPELSPIVLRNSSKRISLDFRSPVNHCRRTNIKLSDRLSDFDATQSVSNIPTESDNKSNVSHD